MQKLTADSPESKSPDLVAENIAKLRELFPELLTEGENGSSVNLDVLKSLVGDQTVTDAEEKYGLNWHGKRKARQLALTPSTGTLRPCPEDSVDWDTTQNLMIEGDNLEVLKLLQKSYAGKVKLIYIDPPYNTGKDFVYPDNFKDNIKNYLEITGQTGEGGNKLSSNPESSGRFHTDWLNMMYPRLKLARNLLREDGVMCISIADGEMHHLKSLLNDVFGEENFIATCVWQKRYSRENRGIIGDVHDYVVFFARDINTYGTVRNLLPLTEASAAVYKNPNNDPNGRWRGIPMTAQGTRPNQMYEVVAPGGAVHTPPQGRCWSTIESEFLKLKAANRIWFGADGNGQPNIIRYLTEVEGLVPWTWWPHEEVGHTDESKKEVNCLFDNMQVFDTPKPVRLLTRILHIGSKSKEGDIILDFFAGSGTTAHAVMAQNVADNGNRNFILVQLPEPLHSENKEQNTAVNFCEKVSKPRNIAELTKERLRRAGKKIREEWEVQNSSREGAKARRREGRKSKQGNYFRNLNPFATSRLRVSHTHRPTPVSASSSSIPPTSASGTRIVRTSPNRWKPPWITSRATAASRTSFSNSCSSSASTSACPWNSGPSPARPSTASEPACSSPAWINPSPAPMPSHSPKASSLGERNSTPPETAPSSSGTAPLPTTSPRPTSARSSNKTASPPKTSAVSEAPCNLTVMEKGFGTPFFTE